MWVGPMYVYFKFRNSDVELYGALKLSFHDVDTNATCWSRYFGATNFSNIQLATALMTYLRMYLLP